MKIVFSKRFLEHEMGERHPESPARLKAVMDFLKREKIFEKHEVDLIPPARVSDEELECVHSPAYVQQLKLLSACESRISSDNPFHKNTFEIARLAAGGALAAARAALESHEFAFALVRPAGHHAARARFSGFCYLNNVAFAVKKTMLEACLKRAMVIDFDQHAGNGTEEIFYHDDSVFFLSFHQNPSTCFPFRAGFEDENNKHIKNVVLEPGTNDDEYTQVFRENVEKYCRSFKPQLIGVSAGFDSYYLDTKCGNLLKISDSRTYEKLGEIINDEAKRVDCPIFGVLEGGYYLPKLGENVWSFLKAFT